MKGRYCSSRDLSLASKDDLSKSKKTLLFKFVSILSLVKINLEDPASAVILLQEVISNYPNSGAALLAEQELIKLKLQ